MFIGYVDQMQDSFSVLKMRQMEKKDGLFESQRGYSKGFQIQHRKQ